jgi:mRNA interferase RelE/StbE
MSYKITISRQVLKFLEKINEPYYSAIKASILSLADNPRPQGCKKLKGRDGYRVRAGNYRIIYEITDQELIVEVIALGHRKDIYE